MRLLGPGWKSIGTMGPGFLESVYQEALAMGLAARGIEFVAQAPLPIYYKGVVLQTVFRAEFICMGEVLVEIKALSRIGVIEEAQLLNYMKATGLKVGLLINFGETSLTFKRFAL